MTIKFAGIVYKKNNMEKKNLFTSLSVVISLSYLPMPCYSDNNSDFFDNLPENTILSIDKPYHDFKRIILELPSGKSDTIWMTSKSDIYINKKDYNQQVISTNTISVPEIDFKSPAYTTKTVVNGMEVIINDTKYPEDAIAKDISGRVSASCIVEKDGSLSNIVLTSTLHPSIDKEAYRILSQTKLIPCKLIDKTYRCRYNITLMFSIKKDADDKKNTKGVVFIVDAVVSPKGVSKRFVLGITRSEMPIYTSEGRVTRGAVRERWHTSLEIDIPENNQNLEQILCQTLFDKGGKAVEESSEKFAKSFSGKIKDKEFKSIKNAHDLSITAHALGYKKDKYYSYAYTTKLDNTSIAHNFIYDIQGNRILAASDILTQSYLDELCKIHLISDLKVLEFGMDDHFIYIGNKEKLYSMVALCQENWYIFSSTIQNILGNKDGLPIKLNENDFEYTKMEGVQPADISQRVINKPKFGIDEKLFNEYILDVWNKNEIQPDSDGFVAQVSFVINKKQAISNFHTQLKNGDEGYLNKFTNLITNNSIRKPMRFAFDGPANTYYSINVNYKGKLYEFVDQMPEYSGGYRALYQWIGEYIFIPQGVPTDDLKGRIFASCIIEEDGSVSSARVETKIDESLKSAIENVLSKTPKWKPGELKGKKVRVKTTFPLKINVVR